MWEMWDNSLAIVDRHYEKNIDECPFVTNDEATWTRLNLPSIRSEKKARTDRMNSMIVVWMQGALEPVWRCSSLSQAPPSTLLLSKVVSIAKAARRCTAPWTAESAKPKRHGRVSLRPSMVVGTVKLKK